MADKGIRMVWPDGSPVGDTGLVQPQNVSLAMERGARVVAGQNMNATWGPDVMRLGARSLPTVLGTAGGLAGGALGLATGPFALGASPALGYLGARAGGALGSLLGDTVRGRLGDQLGDTTANMEKNANQQGYAELGGRLLGPFLTGAGNALVKSANPNRSPILGAVTRDITKKLDAKLAAAGKLYDRDAATRGVMSYVRSKYKQNLTPDEVAQVEQAIADFKGRNPERMSAPEYHEAKQASQGIAKGGGVYNAAQRGQNVTPTGNVFEPLVREKIAANIREALARDIPGYSRLEGRMSALTQAQRTAARPIIGMMAGSGVGGAIGHALGISPWESIPAGALAFSPAVRANIGAGLQNPFLQEIAPQLPRSIMFALQQLQGQQP